MVQFFGAVIEGDDLFLITEVRQSFLGCASASLYVVDRYCNKDHLQVSHEEKAARQSCAVLRAVDAERLIV